MKTRSIFLASLGALVLAGHASAQTVAGTPPAGYVKLTARGGSDSLVAVPLAKRSALMANVTAVTANSITLAATGLAENAFAPSSGTTYYAQFVSGNLEGINLKITANTAAGSFTLDTAGDDLTAHPLGAVNAGASGDVVRIVPFWTVSDVFGATADTVVLDASASVPSSIYVSGDQLRLLDNALAGTDKTPASLLAFVGSSGWRSTATGGADAGTTVLPPGIPLIVRRQKAADAQIVVTGYLLPERFVFRVPSLGSGEARDIAFGFANGGDVSLSGSNLAASGARGAVETSPDAEHAKDVVLDLPTDHRGFDLPPAREFSFNGTDWFEADINENAHLLEAAKGYLLRLRGARAVRYWVQLPLP